MSIKLRSKNPNHRDRFERINTERLTRLSKFLKSCRDRTNPEVFELPEPSRRRNPGLFSQNSIESVIVVNLKVVSFLARLIF